MQNPQDAADMMNILGNTVNGKSTMHFIRDFNAMSGTQHTITGLTINYEHNTTGYESDDEATIEPSLYFSVAE